MKQIINTSHAPAPIGPYSQATLINGFLFVSGQIAISPATNEVETDSIQHEATLVMENIKAILTAAGLTFEHIVKTTILLSDMAHFTEVNTIYGGYFTQNPPARETFAVKGLPKGVNVEISVIAVSA